MNKTTMKKTLVIAGIFLLALGIISCRQARLEAKLKHEHAEFLSIVRYIITPQEKKIFLEIPESEREQFIEEFWKNRDSDLSTEENEFKMTYLDRIDEANRLFTVGRPGWMTDRGEIFILFGPPTNIFNYPMGQGPGTHPYEIWYYGYFPIYFIDQYSTGDYTRYQNDVIHLHEINRALEYARKTLNYEVAFFDFSLKLEKEDGQRLIIIGIPYKNLWLKSTPEGGETTLHISLTALDPGKQTVWSFDEDIPLKVTDEELEEKKKKSFIVRVPIELEPGKYTILATVINTTDEKESKKALDIEIPSSE